MTEARDTEIREKNEARWIVRRQYLDALIELHAQAQDLEEDFHDAPEWDAAWINEQIEHCSRVWHMPIKEEAKAC